MPPLFSIVIPAFNAEGTIERCLRSIVQQSEPSFEIILVDDASTDGTLREVRAAHDQRLKVIQRSGNGGPSACRNDGLAAAVGEFIIFVDADDWLHADYLRQIAIAAGDRTDVDYVITRYRLVSPTGSVSDRQSPELDEPLESFLADRIVSSVWAKAFRSEPIQRARIRFPDVRYMEDSAFNVAFLLASRRAAFAASAVYNYSKLEDSATMRAFDEAVVKEIESGLAATEKVLQSARYDRPGLLEARAIRMLLLQGVFRLAADRRSGRRDDFARTFRRQMVRRFPLATVAAQPFLRMRDKALIASFYASPTATLQLLSLRG